MNKLILQVIIFPNWVIVVAIQPFLPKSHPWKHVDLTLAWLADGATRLAILYGLWGWFNIVMWAAYITTRYMLIDHTKL